MLIVQSTLLFKTSPQYNFYHIHLSSYSSSCTTVLCSMGQILCFLGTTTTAELTLSGKACSGLVILLSVVFVVMFVV